MKYVICKIKQLYNDYSALVGLIIGVGNLASWAVTGNGWMLLTGTILTVMCAIDMLFLISETEE